MLMARVVVLRSSADDRAMVKFYGGPVKYVGAVASMWPQRAGCVWHERVIICCMMK